MHGLHRIPKFRKDTNVYSFTDFCLIDLEHYTNIVMVQLKKLVGWVSLAQPNTINAKLNTNEIQNSP